MRVAIEMLLLGARLEFLRITIAIDPYLGGVAARFDNGDADIVRYQFVGELFEHRLDCEFGRRVMAGIGHDHAAELARDGEQMPLLSCPHPRKDGTGKAMIAEHIGVKRELGRFHVLHLDRASDADSRIVD